MTTLAMASPGHAGGRPNRRTVTRRILGSIYRNGLLWAGGAGLVSTLVWAAIPGDRVGHLLGALIGAVVAVLFLASGRAVHILERSGSWLAAMGLFIVQVVVLGVLAGLLADDAAVIFLPGVAVSVVVVALAWTVGVVVAGRRPQRIYEDLTDSDVGDDTATRRRTSERRPPKGGDRER